MITANRDLRIRPRWPYTTGRPVLLTRIWSVILAVLAVGCLAGMFLLSAGGGGGFTEADKAAIRAVTEAGVAALEAEIQASPVQGVSGVLSDPRLVSAVNRTEKIEPEELPAEELPLDQILAEVAENLRVNTSSNITLAVVDKTGAIAAVNGIAEPNIGELVASDAFKAVPPTEEAIFSITLGSEIYVTKVTKATSSERRILAVDTLRIGAGSLLRKVLGSQTPAGLVRKGQLVGDIIGDVPVSAEIETLARDHQEDVSDQGASRVFTVGSGDGRSARLPRPRAGPGRARAIGCDARRAVVPHRGLEQARPGRRTRRRAGGIAPGCGQLRPADRALPRQRRTRGVPAPAGGDRPDAAALSGVPGGVAGRPAPDLPTTATAVRPARSRGRPRARSRRCDRRSLPSWRSTTTSATTRAAREPAGAAASPEPTKSWGRKGREPVPEATPARRKRRTGSRPQEPVKEPIAEEAAGPTTVPTPQMKPLAADPLADEPMTEADGPTRRRTAARVADRIARWACARPRAWRPAPPRQRRRRHRAPDPRADRPRPWRDLDRRWRVAPSRRPALLR